MPHEERDQHEEPVDLNEERPDLDEEDLRAAYDQLCASYHAIDDFRMKLLGLLPLATGTGIFVLVKEPPEKTMEYLGPIGAFGFVVTLGLLSYELYGIAKCGAIIDIGKSIEGLLRIRGCGHFLSRPRETFGFVNEPFAAAIIYSAVLASWMYIALSGTWSLRPVPVSVYVSVCVFLAGFAFVLAYEIWLRWGARAKTDKLDHVALRVAQYDSTVRWYKEKLGFKVERQWLSGDRRHAYLRNGSVRLEIMAEGDPEPTVEAESVEATLAHAGYHHFCLSVQDLDATLKKLEGRCVPLFDDIFVVNQIGRRLAFIRDNSGNMIELAEASPVHRGSPRERDDRGVTTARARYSASGRPNMS